MTTIEMARMIIRARAPYLAPLLFLLIPNPSNEGTLSVTSRMVLTYNVNYMAKLSDAQGGGVLMHELSHIIREHFKRGEGRDPHLMNIAGDIVINDAIKEEWELPTGALYAKTFKFPEGLTTEEYYELLLRNPPSSNTPSGGSGGGDVCSGSCGSCAHTQEDEDPTDTEDVSEGSGMEGRSEQEIESALVAVAQELSTSKHAGSVAGSMKLLLEHFLKPPKIDWRNALRDVLNNTIGRRVAGGADFSRARPSRKSLILGKPIRSIVAYEPEVAAIVDTSGSMRHLLADALREVGGVLSHLALSEMWLIEVDTKVATKPRRISIADLQKGIEVHGLGGTEFEPGIVAANELSPRPQIILYFTDGYGAYPAPDITTANVIWVLLDNKEKPPWGSCIHIDV